MGKWIDITQPLESNIAHWTEDEPFAYNKTVNKEDYGSVNIGKISMSKHIGTHVDAQLHFKNDGEKIIEIDIERYIGKCTIIDIKDYPEIDATILKKKVQKPTQRLLIKTNL